MNSNFPNIVPPPARLLAERVWYTKHQASLLKMTMSTIRLASSGFSENKDLVGVLSLAGS